MSDDLNAETVKCFFFFFEILSDLNQAVPSHLAHESQTRYPKLGSSPTKSQKKTFRVGGPPSPFSFSFSFILSFVLLPFFLNTK